MWSESQGDALSQVFDALNASDIPWMILRNYEGLPCCNRSKDVDLAVPEKQLEQSRLLVNRSMRSQGYAHVSRQRYHGADCNTYFSSGAGGVCSIKIDFLNGFVWRGARIIDFQTLYRNRDSYKDFSVPNKFYDGFMLWVKPLLTGGIVKEKYVSDIEECINVHPEEFQAALEFFFGSRLGEAIWTKMERGDLAATIPYKAELRRAVWIRAFHNRPFGTFKDCLAHIWLEVRRRVRRAPGTMLAVVGPDGVGKTTFINLLQDRLADVLVKDTDAITVRHFRPHILPNIKELLAGDSYDASKEEFTNPHRAEPAGLLSSLIRLSYYWADYLVGYLFSIRPFCRHGNVVIFDRYFYDFLVDPRRSRLKIPYRIRSLFLFMVPKPDLVFFLDCDAKTVYARKQELTEVEISRQLDVYRALASKDKDRFVILNASLNSETSCDMALKALVNSQFAAA